ncbi:MAG: dipeptidase [Pseudomonadales bacterium]|nr:dipeptidase [Pseudomonadales bacterium]
MRLTIHQHFIASFISIVIILQLGACASKQPQVPLPESLARKHLIVDTHIDVPYRLHKLYEDVTIATENGDFDYPRAKAGGLDAVFMSIYIPSSVDALGQPGIDLANTLIDLVEGIAKQAPDKFVVSYCTQDVFAAHSAGKIAMPMGMENGGPMLPSGNLAHFYQRGIRYVTLAHAKSNAISDSSYDENEAWNGLSEAGAAFIQQLNNTGIMVDISHVSDKAFWQVIKLSKTPIIASHSSARHFTAGFQRNMSDAMIKALGEQGGVIQINYGSNFLTQKAQDYGKAVRDYRKQYSADHQLAEDSEALKSAMSLYLADKPYPYASLSDVLDHIDHVVSITGVKHVGLGSDYDGVGDSLPTGLKDVASYPKLIGGLQQRGYNEDEIALILGGNLMRIWQTVEAYALQKGNPPLCKARH